MSSYCTKTDIIIAITEARLIELSNDLDGATSVDDDVVNYFIAQQSAMIESELYNSYQFPLTESEPLLTEICTNLVCYCLFKRKIEQGLVLSQDMPIMVTKRYSEAKELIQKLKSQEIVLVKNIDLLIANVLVNHHEHPVLKPQWFRGLASIYGADVGS